jgi:hypothetical protein
MNALERIMRKPLYKNINKVLVVILLSVCASAYGQRRIIDHVETKIGSETNTATIFFNVPIRYVSHLENARNNEIEIRVKPVITPGSEEEFLGEEEVITWRGTAEIPLERIVFQGELLGTSTLLLSFGTAIGPYRINDGGDQFSLSIQLEKGKVVENIELKQTDQEAPVSTTPAIEQKEQVTTAIGSKATEDVKIPEGNYVVNLLSQQRPIDFSKIAPVPLSADQRLYSTEAVVKGAKWNRLRVGFFKTQQDAIKALTELRHFYPQAWVDLASPEEKGSFLFESGEKKDTPGEVPIMLPKGEEVAPGDSRLTSMMDNVRRVMTAGDYPKAIRMLTAVLETEKNPYEKEALELLGLARERNGQYAHANAEYNKYLERYPEGEDADRVRQRLAGLLTASQKPKEKLRSVKQETRSAETPWDIYGSLYQAYREDRIDSEFVDDEDSVTRSQIDTNLDITARRRTDDYDIRVQLSGGYEYDMLSDGPGSDESLSAAYIDVENSKTNISTRFGRQRFRSSGILNRFDGGVLGYRFNDDTKVNVYAGVPVERSSDTFIRDDKYFYGLNAELNSLFDDVDITLFAMEQRSDGLVDRRAVGAEARYFDDKRSIFGLIDYDIFYNELNTILVQSNWTVTDNIRLYANYDYRTNPILTTNNALQGQSVFSIEALKDLYTSEQIYDLAQDRTATSNVFSFGGTMSLSDELQLSGDLTLSNVSHTPASGGVEATEETGNELFYTAQVIKNNLIKKGDIGILSLRYADTMSSDTVTLSANSRYPITNLWRIKPKLTASYRDNKNNDDTRLQLGGLLQGEYRFRNDFIIEMEIGANWYDESSSTSEEDFLDYFLGLGYRWTF